MNSRIEKGTSQENGEAPSKLIKELARGLLLGKDWSGDELENFIAEVLHHNGIDNYSAFCLMDTEGQYNELLDKTGISDRQGVASMFDLNNIPTTIKMVYELPLENQGYNLE